MSVISFSTELYSKKLKCERDNAWLKDMSKLAASVSCTSQEVTCILSLISLSLCDGVPLPPYLKPPETYHLNDMLAVEDPDILGIEHFLEPGYAAFAVAQVTSKLISYDLQRILNIVKSLVGEVDFSVHVVPSAHSSDETLAHDKTGKGKQE